MATARANKKKRIRGARVAPANAVDHLAHAETISEVGVKRKGDGGISLCTVVKTADGEEWITCGACCLGPIQPILDFICQVCEARVVLYKSIPHYRGGFI